MTNRRFAFLTGLRRPRSLVVAAIVVGTLVLVVARGSAAARHQEIEELARLLKLRDRSVIAEIGAGSGWLTIEVARRVPGGRVYSTELSRDRLQDIRDAVADAGVTNVTVVEGGDRTSRLEPGCCDAIFMRRVYHHFTDVASMTASLYDALKPGGRLVIIEFDPDGPIGLLTRMGLTREQLVAHVTAAGFVEVTAGEWPRWEHYVAVFERR
jgi:protein-L-isoaspartate O-methyltransferase